MKNIENGYYWARKKDWSNSDTWFVGEVRYEPVGNNEWAFRLWFPGVARPEFDLDLWQLEGPIRKSP
jgi:hypothetical protein